MVVDPVVEKVELWGDNNLTPNNTFTYQKVAGINKVKVNKMFQVS